MVRIRTSDVQALVEMGATRVTSPGDGTAKEMAIRHGEFESLPQEVTKLLTLEQLVLWNCHRITTLPQDLGLLKRLEQLSVLSCSALSSLPHQLTNLKSLRKLSLWGCTKLKSLPGESLLGLSNLEVLNLHNCKALRSLPLETSCLWSLKELILTLCEGLESLPNLTTLSQLHFVDVCAASDSVKRWEQNGRKAFPAETPLSPYSVLAMHHVRRLEDWAQTNSETYAAAAAVASRGAR